MIFLCKLSDIPAAGAKRIARGPRPAIAVFRIDGKIHATADKCTHGTALLSRGKVEGNRLFCPLHQGSFDIRTGEPVDLPCEEKLEVYAVELRGDEIWAAIAG